MKTHLIFLILFAPFVLKAQCNGHVALCNKHYDKVAYLTTHNAFNAQEDGFNLPNQTFGLTRQLQDGVRGLMLDVYVENGVATVYHGFSFLGTTTLASNLTEVKDFLTVNPNEVVTILFETYIPSSMMDSVITQVGLKSMLHVQTLGEPWPTLQEMIDTDKRLVIFSDHNNGQPEQDWYHYMWDFAVETEFENNVPSNFSCDFNRGNATNDLFIVNHFVTDASLGTGQIDQAEIINQFPYFYNRINDCQLEKQKFPNFPTVDFYERGQTMLVIDSLNGIPSSVGIHDLDTMKFSAYPNPSNGQFQFIIDEHWNMSTYQVFNLQGLLIENGALNTHNTTINLSASPQGVYFLSMNNDGNRRVVRLIKL